MMQGSASRPIQMVNLASGVVQIRDVIERLTATVTEENKLLAEGHRHSLESIIQRKGQLLLELTRSQKHIQAEVLRTHLRHDIFKLRNAMAENKSRLSVHFAAAKEITDSILEVMRDNDSDGTYLGWSVGGTARQ